MTHERDSHGPRLPPQGESPTQLGIPVPQRHELEKKDEGTHTMPMSRREIFGGMFVKQQAYLEISGLPDSVPRGVELGDGEVSIGRSADCEISLQLANISRRHARIYCLNDEYHLEDLNSTNGSYVNGVQVSRCVLRNNDLIQIGEARILFVEEKIRQ